MKKSELRKGYTFIERYIDEGCSKDPIFALTEGDLRLCAELCNKAYIKGLNNKDYKKGYEDGYDEGLHDGMNK